MVSIKMSILSLRRAGSSINVREHYNCDTKGKLNVHIEKFPHNCLLSAAKKLSCLHWSHSFMILLLLMLGLMVDTCSIRWSLCCSTQLQSIIHFKDLIWEDWSDRWSHKSFAKCHLDLGNHLTHPFFFVFWSVGKKITLANSWGEINWKSTATRMHEPKLSKNKFDITAELCNKTFTVVSVVFIGFSMYKSCWISC